MKNLGNTIIKAKEFIRKLKAKITDDNQVNVRGSRIIIKMQDLMNFVKKDSIFLNDYKNYAILKFCIRFKNKKIQLIKRVKERAFNHLIFFQKIKKLSKNFNTNCQASFRIKEYQNYDVFDMNSCDGMYLILSGKLEIRRESKAAKLKRLNTEKCKWGLIKEIKDQSKINSNKKIKHRTKTPERLVL